MQFCDDCGSMMVNEDGRMVCTDCGAAEEQEAGLSEAYESTTEQSTDDVIETEEGLNFEGKPKDDQVTCEECGHGEAYYTIKQTASADEPPTRFFKCVECGHRWRSYN
jgi:DNA-directed RNA polymerase subunit M